MKRKAGSRAEIVAVGTELLGPNFRDTDSAFLAGRLDDLGISIGFRTIVGDDREDLVACLRTALKRSRLVIVSGGLGPTEDDRTREAAAEALGRKLLFDPGIQKWIRERFRRRGSGRMPSSNRKQCFVIEGAEVLANPNGTAPGLWIEDGLRRLVLLPGPPRELEPMFDNSVRPKLAGPDAGFTVRRVLRVTGLPESRMEDKLKSVYPRLPPGIGVTTLAYPGDMQIRLTVRGVGDSTKAGRELACAVKLVCGRLGEHVYSAGGEALEEVVGGLLKRRNASVACAESCTGGLLGHRLTNVPGSSAYFLEGVIAYSDRAKIRRLGVLSAQIRVHGAVSAQVAEAMARGIRTRAGADFGLAVTGVAGPGGGSVEKPVGLVFTALAWEGGVSVERNIFPGSREIVKSQSAQKALDMLRRRLLLEIRETA